MPASGYPLYLTYKKYNMRVLVGFCKWFVGLLFIFSGLVKLNDPLGFSYKLDEYFSSAVLGLEFLQPYALPLALFLVITEVLLGTMLILGYFKKFTLWSLLLMILFFTFLTFYSAYFNKVTDCGCFGDAIPLTPWQSFYKDVILLLMIIILFVNSRLIEPLLSKIGNATVVLVCFVLCLLLGYHVLSHLPVLDFRAYKIGTHVPTAIQRDTSIPDIYAYDWYYTINGKQEIIRTEGTPPTQYEGKKYDRVEVVTIQEAPEAKIHDFSITKEGKDFTQEMLQKDKVAFVLIYDMLRAETSGLMNVTDFAQRAQAAGYEVYGLSANTPDQLQSVLDQYNIALPFYITDGTQLKTAVRSNPGVLLMERGVITGKAHWNDFEDLEL